MSKLRAKTVTLTNSVSITRYGKNRGGEQVAVGHSLWYGMLCYGVLGDRRLFTVVGTESTDYRGMCSKNSFRKGAKITLQFSSVTEPHTGIFTKQIYLS